MSDLTISGPAMAAVSALLLSLTSAIGVLFWALIGSLRDRVAREKELTDRLVPAVEENTRTLTRLLEAIQRFSDRLERLEHPPTRGR